MNTSSTASPTLYQVNHSSCLTNGYPIVLEQFNGTNITQSQGNQNGSNSVNRYIPDLSGEDVQQQNSSPSARLSSHEIDIFKLQVPNSLSSNSRLNEQNTISTFPSQMTYQTMPLSNVTDNISITVRNPKTPSPFSQMNKQMIPSPNVTINNSITARNSKTPSPSSQMNNQMMHSPNVTINNSITARNSTTSSQSSQLIPSPNVTINNSIAARNPKTPSPSLQMNKQIIPSPNVTINNSITVRNPGTPSPSSQMNIQMIHSSNETALSAYTGNATLSPVMNSQIYYPGFPNNSTPATSTFDSQLTFPPFTSLLSNGSPFPPYFIRPTPKDPPPPYSTAIQNNQSEATYTELRSVQPFNALPNSSTAAVTLTTSAYVPNGFSYSPNLQEIGGKTYDMPDIVPIDEGIGTSSETSQNSSVIAYGDDSLIGACGYTPPIPSLFDRIQPKSEPMDICTLCGGFLTFNDGRYQCETCTVKKPAKALKRKKKQTPVLSKKNETVVCENCKTEKTSLWRRDPQGFPLCNACGLYLKLHNNSRPQHMRKDKIQRRIRKPKKDGTKSEKKITRPRPKNAAASSAVTVNNNIPYFAPSTSNSPPGFYLAPIPTTINAGASTSYQFPQNVLQSIPPTYSIHNNVAFEEISNQNTQQSNQYIMQQL